MLSSRDVLELYRHIRHWMSAILTVSQIAFYFVKDGKFQTFATTGSTQDGVFHQN